MRLLVLLSMLCAGAAHAVPFTWTADAWNPNSLVSGQTEHTFSILDEGFRPGIDTISGINLVVRVADDAGNDYWWADGEESVKFKLDSGSWSSPRDIDGTIDLSLSVPTSLLLDGLVKMVVAAHTGDFKLLSATLTVSGDRRATAVPEPGNLVLLGIGLLIVAAWNARRRMRSVRAE